LLKGFIILHLQIKHCVKTFSKKVCVYVLPSKPTDFFLGVTQKNGALMQDFLERQTLLLPYIIPRSKHFDGGIV
jgi:hypothetical protein